MPRQLLRQATFSRIGDSSLLARHDEPELLDSAELDATELAANLADIQRVNRLAGGVGVILCHLPGLVCRVPRGRPVTILDLATGAGDIPRAILEWAIRNSRPIALTASDLSPAILVTARRTLEGYVGVSFARYDARAVPLPDRTFDIILCSLALHHFPPREAERVLREMDRLSCVGFIVNDLRRSLPAYAAAWATSRVATRNRLTRHDMPLSVRRAYTPRELRALVRDAGLEQVTISTHSLFRMAAVQSKSSD
jgi:ubiquinone/menaquinone biosynthesis C-methylase UbiE